MSNHMHRLTDACVARILADLEERKTCREDPISLGDITRVLVAHHSANVTGHAVSLLQRMLNGDRWAGTARRLMLDVVEEYLTLAAREEEYRRAKQRAVDSRGWAIGALKGTQS